MIYLILFVGAIIRLFSLGSRPFDGDEGIIVKLTNANWQDLFSEVANDVHPPLYHALVKITTITSVNEWTVRIGSALLGILAIYLIYIFTKNILDKKLALVTSFFAAISPYLLYPAQEARMYALFLVLSLLSFYFFYKLLKDKKTKNIVWYILFSALMLYTQYLGFVIIGSQVIYLLFRKDQYRKIKIWTLSYVAMILLFIPQISTTISQFQSRVTEQSQAISLTDNIKGLIGAFYRFGAGRLFLDINPSGIKELASSNIWLFLFFLLSILVPFFLLGYGKYYLHKENKKIFWFVFTPVAIACLLALFSSEVGSRASRYLIYIYPFYIMTVAYATIKIWPKLWGKIITIIFIIVSLTGIYIHFFRDVNSPGADEVAHFLSENYKDNEIILIRGGFGGGETWALDYYLNDDQQYNIIDMFGDYEPGNLDELKAIKPEDKIDELLENHDTVYFYDMTYETESIPNAIVHNLGQDKENKDLILWEINK